MNSTLNHSSVRSCRRSWAAKLFIFISLALFLFSSFSSVLAYDVKQQVEADGSVREYSINTKHGVSYRSDISALTLYVDNSSPELFDVGRHYTFDLVFGLAFGHDYTYGTAMQTAISELTTGSLTFDEWFAVYMHDYELCWYDPNDNLNYFTPEQYYITADEAVVYYDGVCYSRMTEYLPDMQSGVVDNVVDSGKLYIQLKMHFDFDCTAPMKELYLTWFTPYFAPSADLVTAQYETYLDVSNIISFDYSTVGAMNQISVDIKSQIAGMESALTSSLQQLMDQSGRYWELLLGGYEGSNLDFGMGILYEILNLQDMSYTTLTKMNSSLTTIKTNTTNLVTHTVTIKNLLNGTTKTLWSFLEGQVDILHDDLVDIKDYLDQTDKSSTMGSDVGNSIGSMMDIAGGGDIQLNDIETPELADQSSWNWFSQAIDLVDICLPFVSIVLSFAVFKAVFN